MMQHAQPSQRNRNTLLQIALIGLPFLGLLAWSWRFYDLLHTVPGYGDVLESLWAIEWYRHSLFDLHTLPLFNANVYYPGGWHSATWANGVLIYWVGATLTQLTGSAPLVFNALSLAPFVVSYAGCLALLRRFGNLVPAIIGALLFTFWQFHWLRVQGHVHVAWCIGLLPWFAVNLEQRHWLRAGLVWGLMIHATLYGIFWGGLIYVIFVIFSARQMTQLKHIVEVAQVLGVAGLIAAPLVILYVQGIRADQTLNLGMTHAQQWASSLNSLVAPNVFSPFAWVRTLARLIYSGRIDESSVANLGLSTWILTSIGAALALRMRRHGRYLALAFVCVLLSLGPILEWNGNPAQINWLTQINAGLWQVAHGVRPGQFESPTPEVPFAKGVPLPGYIFYALVPFSESARVLSRYMLVGMLGCVVLLSAGLNRLKGWAQIGMGCLMLLETSPVPISGVPVPVYAHPAYRWISAQPDAPANAVFEIWDNRFIPIGGEAIYAATFHHRPALNGLGSFLPRHIDALQKYVVSQQDIFASPAFAAALSHYGTRFVVLHLRQKEKDTMLWSQMQRNPLLRTQPCFAPDPADRVWPLTLCVAEIKSEALQTRNLMLANGWGAPEDWGVWATTLESQAQFMAARQQTRQLEVSAFPVCIKNRLQKIVIKVNDSAVASYSWQACEVWNTTIQVPAEILRVGLNQITFSNAVAASPHDADPANNDRRVLAVGFTTLRIVIP